MFFEGVRIQFHFGIETSTQHEAMTLVHLVVEENKCLDSQVFIYAHGPTEFRNTKI